MDNQNMPRVTEQDEALEDAIIGEVKAAMEDASKGADTYMAALIAGRKIVNLIRQAAPEAPTDAKDRRIQFLEGLVTAYGPKSLQYDIEHPNDGLNSEAPATQQANPSLAILHDGVWYVPYVPPAAQQAGGSSPMDSLIADFNAMPDNPDSLASALPAATTASPRCTCPSGDGSLCWPCPAHPPEATTASAGCEAVAWRLSIAGEWQYFSSKESALEQVRRADKGFEIPEALFRVQAPSHRGGATKASASSEKRYCNACCTDVSKACGDKGCAVEGRASAPSRDAAATEDWRVGEFWSSANPGKKALMLARGIDIENFGRHKDFIRWVGAPHAANVGEDTGRQVIEDRAKRIYATFPGAEIHPWVDGGNSRMQDMARDLARAAIAANEAQEKKA